MSQEDNYEAPFSSDESTTQTDQVPEVDQTSATDPAAESPNSDSADVIEPATLGDESAVAELGDSSNDLQDDPELIEMAQPFVGRWNDLISTTNWEKGRIIGEWRQTLIESDAPANQYSDDAWSRRVGGVTAPHVGRLRRVYDRFSSSYETYEGLYWSHFLAALDWEDAPLWLEGAVQSNWSVSQMREQRWQAHGAVDEKRPTNSQIVEVDTDEDVIMPAQGGGRTKEYGDESGVAAGPVHEDPDFGEEELNPMANGNPPAPPKSADVAEVNPTQPFAGLPELPDDLSDVVEELKLTILRYKSAGWQEVSAEVIQQYLDAVSVMLRTEN
ncbi:MAG: hypothetical protein GY904_07120 [Planctomycetaceae bacterium]|nr:hypothetical protein [Planctomycetaceae bacterium]